MNKKLMYHEKGYQKNYYMEIKELYKKEKYNILIKRATEYLELFPDDINVRFMRAKSYRVLKMFENAIDDLKYNLGIDNTHSIDLLMKNIKDINEHSLSELYFAYYYLNMYNEALELLPLVYETKCIKPHSAFLTELIMKTQLGEKVKINKNSYSLYVQQQIVNYSEEETLKHINEHLQENNSRSVFKEEINLKYLFDLVKNNLNKSQKANKQEILEIYYFSIANVGYSDGIPCSFIKVVVVPNTNNIISMYPTNEIDCNCISSVECDYDKLFCKKDEKVKRLSRIDKFNAKYGGV